MSGLGCGGWEEIKAMEAVATTGDHTKKLDRYGVYARGARLGWCQRHVMRYQDAKSGTGGYGKAQNATGAFKVGEAGLGA